MLNLPSRKHLVFNLMGEPNNIKKVKSLANKFSEYVKRDVIKSPEVVGTLDFLKEFSEKLNLFVSSNTPQKELEEIIEKRGMTSYFKAVYGNPPMNKTDAVKKILKEYKFLTEELIFIGDANSDYIVAKECGLRFIGIDSGLNFEDKNIKLCQDMHEIANEIRKALPE